MEQEARARMADLRSLLGRHPKEARRTLEALLQGNHITFTPVSNGARRFSLSGAVAAGAVFINPGDPNGI